VPSNLSVEPIFNHSIEMTKFVLMANIVDGFESEFEYLAHYLCNQDVKSVCTVSHPLDRRSKAVTAYRLFIHGKLQKSKVSRRPHRPPLTHIFDFVFPVKFIRGDVWIAFNPVQAAIARLRMNRKALLVHWAIDFVPQKSMNRFINNCYRSLERFMFRRVDVQVENSRAALEMRQKLLGRKPAFEAIAPIGVFEADFVTPFLERLDTPKVVYFGSIDERNDARFVADVARQLCNTDPAISFHFVGSGPLAEMMKHQLSDLVEGHRIVFHGFVRDQAVITKILGECAVAVAPFLDNDKQFTKFADPQKIKYYLAAGLPIFLTDVPPNAQDLAKRAGCTLLTKQDGANMWADQILLLTKSPSEWSRRANLAFQVGIEFERTKIYKRTLGVIGTALMERSAQ